MKEKKVYDLGQGLNTSLRYAVLGSKDRFLEHKHAWKVWRTLKEWGCVVYPVANELTRIDGTKVYPDLLSLQDKIDVVVPCLRPEFIPGLVRETQSAGAKLIWFQEKNFTKEFEEECIEAGIEVARGCTLKHKTYSKLFCFLNPCYWHGFKVAKVPKRR